MERARAGIFRSGLTIATVIVALSSCRGEGSGEPSADPPASTPGSTTVPDHSDADVLEYEQFIGALTSSGITAKEREGKWLQRFFGVPVHRLNAGGPMYVHEFPTTDALEEFRRGVSADGSTIPTRDGNGSVIIEWGAPRMYGKGRVLVIYFGHDRSTRTFLVNTLGPPFTGPQMTGF